LYQRPPVVGRQALLESIRRIGLLQLDSIHIVARSHYLVMLSRVGLYDSAELDALLYPDRRLFEQWAHAACLIPDDLVSGIAGALHEFMAFHASERLAIERLEPAALGPMLLERVKAGNRGRS
jgi:hypothetical protein